MSLRWLHLSVIGPLLLLAGLAWWGTRSQLKAARSDALQEATRLAPALVDPLRLDLEASLRTLPRYPDPPVPGLPSPKDDILQGDDPEALADLRDDPAAGLSPAGLPRRVLAALVLHRVAPAEWQNPVQLADLLTLEAPSVLSTRALETLIDDEETLAHWQEEEAIRRLARARGTEAPEWFAHGEELVFLRSHDDRLETLAVPRRLATGLADGEWLPSWARVDFVLEGEAPPPDSVASAVVQPGRGLTLHLALLPEVLEAPVRRQQRWTYALLAAAVLAAGLALFAIHRSVARERRLAELKGQFVSSVSHELRAPLGSIRLMAEALQRGKVVRPAEFHGLIAREGARLSHLIENVLDFTRIDEGRKRYDFEESDLAALVRETLRVMEPLADERRVRLASELEEVVAEVDPHAVQQALVNLLDNAIKFSPEGTTVTVSLSAEADVARLSVRDEGPGIPEAERQRIFERFHRLGNELRRETQGAGIGLSIVRHIAAAHGGRISVNGDPPAGVSFTLELPLRRCDC